MAPLMNLWKKTPRDGAIYTAQILSDLSQGCDGVYLTWFDATRFRLGVV